MPELLNLLSRLLELRGTLLAADDFGAMDEGLRGVLVELNVLTPARTAKHIVCDGCYEGHVEEVSRVPVAGRKPGLFIRCPEAGWVSVHPDRLRQWKLNVDRLVALLAAAIKSGTAAEVIVRNAAWRLGEIAIAGAAFGVVLVVAGEDDFVDLMAQLGRSCPLDKTVLVTARFPSDEPSGIAAVLPLESAFRFGAAGFQIEADRIRSSLRTDVGPAPNTFRLRGQFWELTFDGQAVHMKDSVGLAYIARMLTEPDRDIPAVSLLAARAGIDPLIASGSSGKLLDDAARNDYSNRYTELQDDLSEARENNDLALIEQIEIEMDQLATELASAAGLGGRLREQSDVEKVRKAVSMAVSRAIESIGAEHKSLGRHLLAAISPGRVFRYSPPNTIDWLT